MPAATATEHATVSGNRAGAGRKGDGMSETHYGALDRAPAKSAASPSADAPKSPLKLIGLLVGVAALVAIVAMPQPAGLSVAGQHMLGIFVFAVVIWMTEAVDYAASAIMLMALITFLLALRWFRWT